MEQEREELEQIPEQPETETPKYQMRPQWQIWAARIGLVLFLLLLFLYYFTMFTGGRR